MSDQSPANHSPSGIKLDDVMNSARFGAVQIRVVAICFFIAMLDGFDTQSVAFVGPSLRGIWDSSDTLFGVMFGAGLFGTMIGAMVLGSAADRLGRKRVVMVSVAVFGLMSFLSSFSTSLEMLILLRFITGLGLGGAIPNIISLTSEYAPQRVRMTVITLMFCGFPLGAISGGIISAQLIPAFGWPAVFILGGALPIVMVPVIWFGLPESVRYLALSKSGHAKALTILHKIQPGLDGDSILASTEPQPEKKVTVKALFEGGRANWTMLLWIAMFFGMLLIYFLVNWIPAMLAQEGLSHKEAVMGVVTLNLGGVIGSLVISRLMDRFGPFRPLAAILSIGAIGVALIGTTAGDVDRAMVVIFLTGLFISGSLLAMPALSARYYSTAIRGTGVGWSMAIGRTGSAIGPVLGGALLTFGLSTAELFLAAAIPAVLAAITIFAMRRYIPANREGSDST